MTAYDKNQLPLLVAPFKPTNCVANRNARHYTAIPGTDTANTLVQGTIIKAIGFWMRDGGNNRFTRFSFCVFAPFDTIFPEQPQRWMMVVIDADRRHAAVEFWLQQGVTIVTRFNDPPIGNWDGPVHMESAVAPPGFAMAGLESHYWNNAPCGQICGQIWWARNLFTGETRELKIGAFHTPWKDNYPVDGYNAGSYIQSIVLGWDTATGDDNGIKMISKVTYLSGLEKLQYQVPEPYRCCGSDQRWKAYPTGTLERLRCTYDRLHSGEKECELLLDGYCSNHMDEEICLERCQERNKNCDGILQHWCQNVRKATAVEVFQDPKLARICGCFLPPQIYSNFFADLEKAGIGKIQARPEFKECYFGPCSRNSDLLYALKNRGPQCPNISACLSEITVTNTGEIKGPVRVENNNDCNFTDGTRPPPTPVEETGKENKEPTPTPTPSPTPSPTPFPAPTPVDKSGWTTQQKIALGIGVLVSAVIVFFIIRRLTTTVQPVPLRRIVPSGIELSRRATPPTLPTAIEPTRPVIPTSSLPVTTRPRYRRSKR